EELHFFCSSTKPGQFAKMLQRHGEGNDALRRIVYDSSPKMPMQLAPFTRLSRRLRDCFTDIYFLDLSSRDTKMSFCDHFRSLTSFDVSIYLTSPNLVQLSQLTQLVFLRLSLYFTNLRPDGEASHRPPLPQLPSVVLLQLRPNFQSHRDLDH